MLSRHKSNKDFKIDEFCDLCREKDVENPYRMVSQMITLDCIISNTDRHWTNFGIIRNADRLSWVGMMPIFDNGSSLWYNIYEDSDVGCDLRDRMTGKMLSEHVNDIKLNDFIDIGRLHKTADEAVHVLSSSQIPRRKQRGMTNLLSEFVRPRGAGYLTRERRRMDM